MVLCDSERFAEISFSSAERLPEILFASLCSPLMRCRIDAEFSARAIVRIAPKTTEPSISTASRIAISDLKLNFFFIRHPGGQTRTNFRMEIILPSVPTKKPIHR